MTSLYPVVLSTAAAYLGTLGPSSSPAFAVHTGRAPASPSYPYAVLGAADVEAASEYETDADKGTAPSACLLTARVFGAFGDAVDVSALVADAFTSAALDDALALAGRHVLRVDRPVTVTIPDGDTDTKLAGRQVSARFHVEPTA